MYTCITYTLTYAPVTWTYAYTLLHVQSAHTLYIQYRTYIHTIQRAKYNIHPLSTHTRAHTDTQTLTHGYVYRMPDWRKCWFGVMSISITLVAKSLLILQNRQRFAQKETNCIMLYVRYVITGVISQLCRWLELGRWTTCRPTHYWDSCCCCPGVAGWTRRTSEKIISWETILN